MEQGPQMKQKNRFSIWGSLNIGKSSFQFETVILTGYDFYKQNLELLLSFIIFDCTFVDQKKLQTRLQKFIFDLRVSWYKQNPLRSKTVILTVCDF